jgi:hypothetical protein
MALPFDEEGKTGPGETTPVRAFPGNNIVKFNQAAVILIIQQFLDREMRHPPKVTSVTWDGASGWFDVKISEKT